MVLEQEDIHILKTDFIITLDTKINSKCITDLNIKPNTIKLLECIGENLGDLGLDKDFFKLQPQKPNLTD